MQEYEQAVFISYAWGTEREEIVNQIDEALQKRGIKIIRDKRELGYKGSIRDFMQRIGQGNCVIVVISDKYLRSPNCMFELVEIAENKEFHDRIFPIVLGDAKIYDPVERAKYVEYWEDKNEELVKAVKKLDPANLQGLREDVDLYDRIRDEISGLASALKDMNTLTPEVHQDSDFSELYDAIVKRMQERPTISASPLSTLGKQPKVLYAGLFFIVAVLAILGGMTYRNNRTEQINATTSAASIANSADTATAAAKQDSLTATENAMSLLATVQDEVTSTATSTSTATLTSSPTVTSTATPITPPLDCLDTNRWGVAINTDDTPPSDEATIEDNCVTAYKDLGIFASSAGLSFLKDSFRIPGIFGVNTLLPKDPKEVKLTIKLYEVSGGGQGEFWISLSNGIDPEQDSVSITIQPNGAVKYYINGSSTTLLDPINAKPLPYTYEINLAINGNRVSSVVNSTYYQNNLPVNGGPKYLFFGYKKKSNQGTVYIHVDVVDLEFK